MPNDAALRKHLLALLRGGQAHATFDDTVRGFPLDKIGVRPAGLPHSAWELLEHMRIAQHDILIFSRSADYNAIKWPDDYWPRAPKPDRESQWEESAQAVRDDLAEFEKLLQDPARDLYAPFSWGKGQTLLREALLIAAHNSYHLGQLLLVRRALGAWR
jgi:uncharacterized damage-inducible protein DinB